MARGAGAASPGDEDVSPAATMAVPSSRFQKVFVMPETHAIFAEVKTMLVALK